MLRLSVAGRVARASSCLIALAAACGESHPTATEDAASPAEPADGGAQAPPRDGAASSESRELEVWIEPSQSRLCPGQCATLSARVGGAQGPFVYRWRDGEAGETLRVCPSETTSYSVEVVQQTSSAVEVTAGALHGTANIDIEVRDACGEPVPPVPGSSCSFRIPVEAPVNSYAYLAGPALLDGRGDVYLAAQLSGKARVASAVLGKQSTFTRSNQDILLVKLTADCQLLWYRLFSAAEPELTLIDFAVDDAGNMALLTDNRRFEWPGKSYHHTQLSLLDATGTLRWQLADPEEELGGRIREPFRLAFAGDGSLAVRGLRSVCPPHGSFSWENCLVLLDPAGRTSWVQQIDVWGAGLRYDQGRLLVSGMAGPHGAILGMFSESAGPLSYVARLDDQGTPAWLRTTPVTTDTLTSVAHLAVQTDAGEILDAWTDKSAPGGMSIVARRVDLDGNLLSLTKTPLDPRATYPGAVRGLRDGQVVVAASYQESQGDVILSRAVLVFHDASGNVVREQSVSNARSSRLAELDVRDNGDLSMTVGELEDNGVYQTALTINVSRAR